MKRFQTLLICCVLLLSCAVSGCVANRNAKAETRAFTDSAGRVVQIPVSINKIAPSGPLAQMILYTLCPDKLLGLSEPFTRVQKKYMDEKYYSLPTFGKLYGSGGTFNLEEIMKRSPDVIIDMGEEKTGIGADMDSVQEQTGIPVVFIKATFGSMAEAYDALGEILGAGAEEKAAELSAAEADDARAIKAKASELSAYIRDVLDFAADVRSKIPEDERPSVLYSQGEYGNEVNGTGSTHAEVLDYVGVRNAAQMDSILASGGDAVSMEQIIIWNPNVVVLAPDSCFNEIYSDPSWASVDAVQNRRVYEVPIGPYNWLDRPPSVQRVLGILWLGNLVYPEHYDFDMTEKAQEFYRLFFRYDLTADEARELLANSTLIR